MKGLTCRQANSEEEALNMLFEVYSYVKRIFTNNNYFIRLYMYIFECVYINPLLLYLGGE